MRKSILLRVSHALLSLASHRKNGNILWNVRLNVWQKIGLQSRKSESCKPKIQHEQTTIQLSSHSKCCPLSRTRVLGLRRHWSTALSTRWWWWWNCLFYSALKTRKLVLSTAPKTWGNTNKDRKTENGPISRGSQSEVSMVRDLWRKRFTLCENFQQQLSCSTAIPLSNGP